MLDYLKERTSFIVIILVLVVGFGFLVTRSSGTPASGSADILPTSVSLDNAMSRGDSSATVSLIQYSDFLCPSCSYFTTQIMPTIQKDYIDTKKVKFEFRPMAFIATGSTISGEGAYCAVDQGKFWEYHDAIYNYVWTNAFSRNVDPKTTTILTSPIIESVALQAGLDGDSFNTCLQSGEKEASIADATTTANKYGVASTPYIVVNGHKLTGNLSLETVKTLIESQL